MISIDDNECLINDISEIANIVDKDTSIISLGTKNYDFLSGLKDRIDKLIVITESNISTAEKDVYVKNKIMKSLLKKTKKIVFIINLDDDYKNTKRVVKNIIKIENIANLLDINIGIMQDNMNIVGYVDNEKSIYLNDIVNTFKANRIEDIEEKYRFIYNCVCDYLDSKFRGDNYCNFDSNDKCVANREGVSVHQTMGCCYEFEYGSFFSPQLIKNVRLCRHMGHEVCLTRCITCKMFTCKYLKQKGIEFKCSNILLLDCFFTKKQHLILESNFFKTEDEILKKLLEVNYYPYIIYYLLGDYYIH